MAYILKPNGLYDGTSRASANAVYSDLQVASVMTINSNTKTKIATLPNSDDVKGTMAVNLRWSRGVNPNSEGSYYYWETHIGFVYGQIGGNAYNATGVAAINFAVTYHHRVIGEPTALEVDSDETAGSYGAFSLYITLPNYIKLYDVRCEAVSLCGGYPE